MNRVATVWCQGLEYAAEQRPAEILMRDVGADKGGQGSRDFFAAAAARGHYLAQDRTDAQFAAKEIFSRLTPKPDEQDWRAARLARYFKDSRRVVVEYMLQKLPE